MKKLPLYSIVGNKFVLGQMIGQGSFGEVYLATMQDSEDIEDELVKDS